MRAPDLAAIRTALARLQVPLEDLESALRSAKTLSAVNDELDRYRKRVHRAWRRAAFDLHPDRGGDEDEFKRLSAAVNWIDSLKAQARPVAPPPPAVRVVIMRSSGFGFGDTTSATTTISGGWTSTTWP